MALTVFLRGIVRQKMSVLLELNDIRANRMILDA